MQWVAQGFVFRRTSSPFHRLDPRVKLLISIELFTASIVIASLEEVAIASLGVLVAAASARILRRMSRSLVYWLLFASLILVVNLLVSYPLLEALVLALRFVVIVASTSIFFLTTPPDELELVMKWFRLPRDIVFAFVTAVRFVPVLMLDALQIMDAQKSRGLELERGSPILRFRRFIPILIPLVVDAVVRSGELAEAMEARAYGAVEKPTSLYALTLARRDVLAISLSVVLISLAMYLFLLVI